MRNCFEQIMTQNTTNQWNNKLHVKYELTLFLSDWTAQSLELVQMIWSKTKGIISAQLESQNKVVLLPIVNGAWVTLMERFLTTLHNIFLDFPKL